MKSCNWPIGTYFGLLIVLMLLVSGYAPTIENVEQPTETFASSTALPVIVAAPTSSLNPLPSTIKVEQDCLSLESSLPPDLKLDGVWVRQSGKPYLEILEENIKYRIPLYGGGILAKYEGFWSVSPNGEWLAYIDSILDSSGRITITKGLLLRVIHSSGYFLSMDYWPADFQTIQGWIDNENILLRVNHRNIVLNPFSGKWHELLKPDWLEEKSDGGTWANPYQYSPRLDRVIENFEDHSEVRDFVSGETLFGDSELGFFGSTTWSLDGSMLFLTVGESNIVHILKDDKEILKVDLMEIGIFPQGSYDFITNATWSLDNQRILLETLSKTLVLDIKKQKIYEICFTDENIDKTWGFRGEFFSSRDGRYIIIQRSLINEKPYVQTIDILVDIENMRAYRLPNVAYKDYIGWLTLP
jgi:hypothetical protein